jgi:prepilin-type N-terminal cleavage/methylation domain-containing protein
MERLRINGRSGFTLIEVLMALLIFSIIGGIVLVFFIQSSNLWQMLTNQSDLRSAGRNSMAFMTQELRNATRTSSIAAVNMVIPASPNNRSLVFCLPTDADGNGSIIDGLGNTEWDTVNPVQYNYLPLLRQVVRLAGGNQSVIANEVDDIRFEDHAIDAALYNDEIRITLTLRRTTIQNKPVSVSIINVLKLRNR